MVSTTRPLKTARYRLLPFRTPSQQETWFRYQLDSAPWTVGGAANQRVHPPVTPLALLRRLRFRGTAASLSPVQVPPASAFLSSAHSQHQALMMLRVCSRSLHHSPVLPSRASSSHVCIIAIAPELLSLKPLPLEQHTDHSKSTDLSCYVLLKILRLPVTAPLHHPQGPSRCDLHLPTLSMYLLKPSSLAPFAIPARASFLYHSKILQVLFPLP